MAQKSTSSKKINRIKLPFRKGGAPISHGVGRRKTAVARAWLRRGDGLFVVNGTPYSTYFDTTMTRELANKPLVVCPDAATDFDFEINVHGGGRHGQAEAIALAISRAIVKHDEAQRILFRANGLLTVDSRVKERKKPGQPGARKKNQFTKR